MSRPLRSRMCCDGEMQNTPTIMRQHEKHIQNLKPDRWHSEEVDGYKTVDVILEESAPRLGRRLAISHEIFAYAGFANTDAEFQ